MKNKRSVPADAKVVSDLDEVRVKPGRREEFQGLFEKYDKPVLEKLLADGVIYWYELDTAVVHTQAPGMMEVFIVMPDLGTKDKVNAAFEASWKALPEAERSTAREDVLRHGGPEHASGRPVGQPGVQVEVAPGDRGDRNRGPYTQSPIR